MRYEMPTAIVIDDDKATTEVLCDYLTLIKVDVMAVGSNGKDAVELYKKHKPDIVFLDLMMPQYDGFFALENIKRANPDAKVVIVTADLSQKDSKELEALGPTKIILKPFAVEELTEIIEKVRASKSSGGNRQDRP